MADEILHNLPIDNNPSDSVKIAMGTESTPATNITLANFYTLLMSKLGFFKVSNLFSEIYGNSTAMAAARGNLSVPSISAMLTGDSARAFKTNVIEKDSTVAFTPTIGTHPVNKKYVDDKMIIGLDYVFGDISGVGTRTVQINKTMPTINYIVLISMRSLNGEVVGPTISNKTLTSFDVSFVENLGAMQNIVFDWCLIMR